MGMGMEGFSFFLSEKSLRMKKEGAARDSLCKEFMHISYCRLPDKNEQRILPGFSSKNVRKSNYSRGSRDHVYCNIRCCSQKYSVSECERVKTSFCYILQF
jgi:hypothetical protein